MMSMKRQMVLETVNENKADELSAMYNMLIDEKKRAAGKYLCFHHKRGSSFPVCFPMWNFFL